MTKLLTRRRLLTGLGVGGSSLVLAGCDRQADEQAEQRIIINLLNQLALRANHVKGLLQQSAQHSFSGGIDGRPIAEYIASKSGDRTSSASSTMARIARSGRHVGTQASQLT